MPSSYRQRGTLCYIVPPDLNETILEELYRVKPRGMGLLFGTLGLESLMGIDGAWIVDRVEHLAREAMKREPNLLTYSGTPTLVRIGNGGADDIENLRQRMIQASGNSVPVMIDVQLASLAANALGITRCALISPYCPSDLEATVKLHRELGLNIVAARGQDDDFEMWEAMTDFDDDWAIPVLEALMDEHPDLDGIHFSCPQVPVVGQIEELEQKFNLSITSQVGSIMWWARRELGITDSIDGYGKLFRLT